MEIKLASDVWPPFTGKQGEPRVAIELVTKALTRSGWQTTIDMVNVGELTPGLKDGRYDGTAAIWRSPEREAYLLFSKPYLENRLVLVGRKNSDVSAQRLQELAGKKVAIVAAFAYGSAIDEAQDVVFVGGPSVQDNLRQLLQGKVDYMLVDDLLAHRLQTEYEDEASRLLEVGEIPLVVRPLHFAVRRQVPRADEIVARFNAQIERMMADGSIHEILDVAWIRTDMDGDGRTELVLGGTKAGETEPTKSYDWLTLRQPRAEEAKSARIWIEGQTYENWDQVPPRYKVEPEPVEPQRKGGVRFRFDVGL